jgi:hypothetical protein
LPLKRQAEMPEYDPDSQAGNSGSPKPALCENCATVLRGPYCHACGQSAHNPLNSLRAFLADTIGDVAQVNSRTAQSVRYLVARPGFLTRAYLDGHRVRFLQPLQLYFVAATLFFLVATFRPLVTFDPHTQIVNSSLGAVSAGGHITTEEFAELKSRGISKELFQERFRTAVNGNLATFLVGSIVLFTLCVSLLYFTKRMTLAAHAIFVLHWVAFYLLVMIFDRLLPGAVGVLVFWRGVLFLGTTAYLMLALKAVYGESWVITMAKGLVLVLLFNLIMALWVVSVISFAMETI